MWLSLKKFNQNSLEKIKRTPKFRRKRFHGKHDKDEQFAFIDHRLTASHPELSYHEGLAQLVSNYQSFDDLNLITVHHNSENYISDNIEFHRTSCSIPKCQNGSICGNGHTANLDRISNVDTAYDSSAENRASSDHRAEKVNLIKPEFSYSATSSPTSFFSRFRSASPNPGSINESSKPHFNKSDKYDHLPSNSIKSTSCSTFLLPKRPHSSLNYNEASASKRIQYKQTEAFSASEEDLLLDTISEKQSVVNLNCASSTPTKRRDSFLLKLLKKRKSTERNPLDRAGSATNYEYYNQSLDEDYENSVLQNVSLCILNSKQFF